MMRDAGSATSGAGSSRSTATGCRSTDATPVVTLREGGTPLVAAPRRSPSCTGCEVYLKVEGANPTGSFKDRGMTVAISKAAEEGAKAVICASTGNTCAVGRRLRRRGRAWSARSSCPQGKIALGKLAQALVHGAQLLQVDGNFDDCLDAGAQARRALPGRAGQLGQPGPDRGAEDRRVRDRRRARRRPGHPLPAGRQRRQHHRVLEGLPRVRRRRAGHPRARGCGASRPPARRRSCTGAPVAQPVTIATAIRIGNPASWDSARRGPRRVRRPDRRGHRPARSSPPTGCWPPARASSSSRPRRRRSPACCRRTREGLLDPGQRVVCTVTGHGLKDPRVGHRRRARSRRTVPVDAAAAAAAAGPGRLIGGRRCSAAAPVARARARDQRRTSARLRRARARAGPVRRRRRAGLRRPGVDVEVAGEGADACPRDERHLVVQAMRAAFDALGGQPARAGVCVCANRIPHGRGLGSSAAAIVVRRRRWPGPWSSAARTACDDLALLRLAASIEGHPDNVAACLLGGFTVAWTDEAGLRARPARRGATARIVPVVCVPSDRRWPRAKARAAAAGDRAARGRRRNAGARGAAGRGADRAARPAARRPPRTGCTRSTAAAAVPAARPTLVAKLRRRPGIPAVVVRCRADRAGARDASPRHGVPRVVAARRAGGDHGARRATPGAPPPAAGRPSCCRRRVRRVPGSAGHDQATRLARGDRARLGRGVTVCIATRRTTGRSLRRNPLCTPLSRHTRVASDVRARHRSSRVHVVDPAA